MDEHNVRTKARGFVAHLRLGPDFTQLLARDAAVRGRTGHPSEVHAPVHHLALRDEAHLASRRLGGVRAPVGQKKCARGQEQRQRILHRPTSILQQPVKIPKTLTLSPAAPDRGHCGMQHTMRIVPYPY